MKTETCWLRPDQVRILFRKRFRIFDKRSRTVVFGTFQHLRDGDLVRIEPLGITRQKNPPIGSRRHIDPLRMTPRHQCRAGWRADRSRHVKARQPGSFGRHLVDSRSADMFSSETTEVTVTLVIRENYDDIETLGFLLCAQKF